MNIRKIINRRIRHHGDGVDVVGDINAAISANVNESRGSTSHVSSRQRIVQRDGETVVSESETSQGGSDERARD